MADANKTLITRAEITSAEVAASNRKTLTLDGVTIDVGDTGVRDLSALINIATNLDSGRLLLARNGRRVQLWLVNVVVKAGAASPTIVMTNSRSNTSGFYPPYVATGRAVAASGNGTASAGASADVYVNTSLGVVLHGATPGVAYQASLCWDTLAGWPNVLPGVADGSPIGV